MSSSGYGQTSQPNDKKMRVPDIGWKYGQQVGDNRQHVQCNFCQKIMRGGGVSRLKQHLAGGNPNVERCNKCPNEISRAMREYIQRDKKENEDVALQRAQMREDLIGPVRSRYGIQMEDSDNEDVMTEQEYADLQYAREQSLRDVHMAEQGFRRGMPESSSRNPPAKGLMRSQSVKEAWNKLSGKSKKTSTRGKDLTIEEIDPSMFRNKDVKQARLHHLWNPKKWGKSAKHAIARWFIYENVPPHKAQGQFYQMMIDEIAMAGPGVTGPTPYEIGGPILDMEIDDLKEYIEVFKKKWDTYGVTIMCDGWTSITRLAITNFLVYCDGKIIFHKSVNTSGHDKDADYIFGLMDDVVEEIGEKYVVQIITDNQSSYKKAGEMLMQKRPHLFWTSCAAHSIDLVLHDFAELDKVKTVLDNAKRVTNFIYNHSRVLDIMRTYCTGELIRPAQTRFATNFIALSSLLEHKNSLQRMFTSEDWHSNAASRDPVGKRVHATIMNMKFWESAKKYVKIHALVARVLRMVDGEKQATMPYLYEGMKRAKEAITNMYLKSCKQYIDILEKRWKKQVISYIHMAAFYLNLEFQYLGDVGVNQNLLAALRNVVTRIEPNPSIASDALAEVKIFREAMYEFGSATAIRGRNKSDPAEWWFMHGTDAPNLRKIAMRILSQTTSASGCERNWSTFALIHTKVRNRLNYQKLERLVFAQYNMRLKLKFLMKERQRVEFKAIELSNVFEEDEGISEWLDDPGDALLDELDENGEATRPNTFLARWADQYSDDNIGGVSQSQPSVLPRSKSFVGVTSSRARQSTLALDDDDFETLMRGPSQRGKKAVIESSSEEQEDDDENDDNTTDGGNDSGGNDGGGNIQGGFSGAGEGVFFTEEQGFTHATQDEDHGSRRQALRQYERGRGRHCHPQNETQNTNIPHGMSAIMQGVNMINSGLSDMSVSGGSDNFRRGSSSGYQPMYHGSSSNMNTGFGFNSQTSTNSLQGAGSSSHGYGSGYDSQRSSSHQFGGVGHQQMTGPFVSLPTQQTQQPGCTMEMFQKFWADYQAWYSNTMSWADYCQHVYNLYNISLGGYPDPQSVYASARHSTGGWMS